MKSGMRRRSILEIGVSALVGSAISCARGGAASPWRFLTVTEGRTLEAVCAQLIPEDQDPGAKDAGVVNYIDLQLSTRFKRHRPAYRKGIAGIDEVSRTQFGKVFADLTSEQQLIILNTTEEKDRTFFDLLVNHTRQGFYGDPRHGGNRGMTSWKMLGLPFPPVRGRQHYDTQAG
jgi:gluconate 2-dehydrogenase gamma chain